MIVRGDILSLLFVVSLISSRCNGENTDGRGLRKGHEPTPSPPSPSSSMFGSVPSSTPQFGFGGSGTNNAVNNNNNNDNNNNNNNNGGSGFGNFVGGTNWNSGSGITGSGFGFSQHATASETLVDGEAQGGGDDVEITKSVEPMFNSEGGFSTPGPKQLPVGPDVSKGMNGDASGEIYGDGIGQPYVPKNKWTVTENKFFAPFVPEGPSFSANDGYDTHRYGPIMQGGNGPGTGYQQKIEMEEGNTGFVFEMNTGFQIDGGIATKEEIPGMNNPNLKTYYIKINKDEDPDAENKVSEELRKNHDGQHKSRKKMLLKDYIIVEAEDIPEHLKGSSDLDEEIFSDAFSCDAPYRTGEDYAWGLDRVDGGHGLNDEFGLPYKGENIDVYIIDTGVDEVHEQFMDENGKSRVKGYFDCIGTDLGDPCLPVPPPAQRTLCNGEYGSDHGTHIAGSCCGNTVGIAPKANIYSYRVFTCTGSAKLHYIINALDDIVARCTDEGSNRCVVNMSLGAGYIEALNTAVEDAVNAGIVVIVSAGNNFARDSCTKSPSSSGAVITVASSDMADLVSDFSNGGPCVNIIAPGSAIYSAAGIGGYENMWGTSMATPHVVGAAAVLLSEKIAASPEVVSTALVEHFPRTSIVDDRTEEGPFTYPLLHMPCGCGDDGNHSFVCPDGPAPPHDPCVVSDCVTCELDDPNVCTICDVGYGLDGNGGCAKCPDNCESCVDANKCSICAEGYGPVSGGSSCEPCGEGCVDCGKNQGICSQCATNLGRDPANKSQCKACADGCNGCSAVNYKSCIACQSGHGFAGASNMCAPCFANNCAECSVNNNICTGCKEGNFLIANMCMALSRSDCGTGDIEVVIYTDWYPGDVVFEIIDPEGEVYLKARPLSKEWATYRYDLSRYNSRLGTTNCQWKFRMTDSWGDGLSAPAYYEIYSGSRLLQRGGGDYTSYSYFEETVF